MISAVTTELDWQWLCEACARCGWVEAARVNIKAAAAHGVKVDEKKVLEEYRKHETDRCE